MIYEPPKIKKSILCVGCALTLSTAGIVSAVLIDKEPVVVGGRISGGKMLETVIGTVVSKKKSIAIPESELQVLAREFGELKAGETITVELHRLLTILPRARRKADAYKGLKAELKQQGVDLIITSNRSHKNFNDYGNKQ